LLLLPTFIGNQVIGKIDNKKVLSTFRDKPIPVYNSLFHPKKGTLFFHEPFATMFVAYSGVYSLLFLDAELYMVMLESILYDHLPSQNKDGYESYSLLVLELGNLGIKIAEKLESLITKRLSEALEDKRKTVDDRQRASRDNDKSRSGIFLHIWA
jgi:hypothetical protein